MKRTTRLFIVLIAMILFSFSAFASITCHTPRLSKAIKIDGSKIAMIQADRVSGRQVASSTVARTQIAGNGFTKVMNQNGMKYTVHINNRNSFSQVEDYLSIKTAEGHEMTYPLSCFNE